MTVKQVGIRLKTDGKAEVKRDFAEVGQAGKAAGQEVAAGFTAIAAGSDKAAHAADRQMERWKAMAKAAREFQTQEEQRQASQAKYNALLGVGGGTGLKQSDFLSGDELGGKGMSRSQRAGRLNLVRQGADVFTTAAMGMDPAMIAIQQGPQILDALTTSGFKASGAVIALGVGVAGAAAAVLGLAGAQMSYEASTLKLTVAANGLGAASGQTAEQLEAQARAGAAAGDVSVAAARDMAASYANTGRIGGGVMADLIALTKSYALTTGQDAKAATKELGAAFSDPIKGAADLNSKLHFLDASQQRHIENLARSGREAEAQALLVDHLKASMMGAADATTGWAHAFGGLTTAAKNGFDEVGRYIDRLVTGGNSVERLSRARVGLAGINKAIQLQGGTADANQAAMKKAYEDQIAAAYKDFVAQTDRQRQAGLSSRSTDRQGLIDQYNPNAKRLAELQADRARLMGLGVNDPESKKALKELDDQIKALGAGYKTAAQMAAALARQNRSAARDAKADAREAEQAARKAADLDVLRLRGAVELAKAQKDPSAIDFAERELRVRELMLQMERDGLSTAKAKLEAQRQVSAEMVSEYRVLQQQTSDRELAKDGFKSSADRIAAVEPGKDLIPYNAKTAFLESLRVDTGEAFHDGLMAGMTGGNFFDAFAQRLKYAAASALADSLTNSLFGSKSGDKVGLLSKALSFIPGFATGTDSAPGGLSWVGERGKELVNLPKGSKVYNHEESMAIAAANRRALAQAQTATASMTAATSAAPAIHVTMATTIDARGAGPREIDELRREQAQRDASEPARIVAAVQDALGRRLIKV